MNTCENCKYHHQASVCTRFPPVTVNGLVSFWPPVKTTTVACGEYIEKKAIEQPVIEIPIKASSEPKISSELKAPSGPKEEMSSEMAAKMKAKIEAQKAREAIPLI